MTFFTYLNSWTNCLCFITISKWIDLKRSAWRHFVDNKLYFHFLLNFSEFPFVRYVLPCLQNQLQPTKDVLRRNYSPLFIWICSIQWQITCGFFMQNFSTYSQIVQLLCQFQVKTLILLDSFSFQTEKEVLQFKPI